MSHTVAPNSFPIFNGSNYTFWNLRMKAYLKSVGVWHIIESRWTNLDKAIDEFSKDEKSASSANDKVLNAIFTFISIEEFSRISRCVIAKEA